MFFNIAKCLLSVSVIYRLQTRHNYNMIINRFSSRRRKQTEEQALIIHKPTVCFFQHRQAVLQLSVDADWASCLQLSVHAVYLEIASDPTCYGLGPTKLHPLQMPVTSLGCCLCLRQNSYRSEVPMTPSSGLISLLELEWLTEFRETFTYIY